MASCGCALCAKSVEGGAARGTQPKTNVGNTTSVLAQGTSKALPSLLLLAKGGGYVLALLGNPHIQSTATTRCKDQTQRHLGLNGQQGGREVLALLGYPRIHIRVCTAAASCRKDQTQQYLNLIHQHRRYVLALLSCPQQPLCADDHGLHGSGTDLHRARRRSKRVSMGIAFTYACVSAFAHAFDAWGCIHALVVCVHVSGCATLCASTGTCVCAHTPTKCMGSCCMGLKA